MAEPTGRRRRIPALAPLLLVLALLPWPATAERVALDFAVSWAGISAGGMLLEIDETPDGYTAKVRIESSGLPKRLTRFRATGQSSGAWDRETGAARPDSYAVDYRLRRKERRAAIDFDDQGDSRLAVKGPGDTSRHDLLDAAMRRDVLDPLSAFVEMRRRMRLGEGDFVLAVYDGRRRFDMEVGPARLDTIGSGRSERRVLRATAVLRPLAGFDEGDEDERPDAAPREVEMLLSADGQAEPIRFGFPVLLLPATVALR